MSKRDLALLDVLVDPLRAPEARRHGAGAAARAAAEHPNDTRRLFERHRLGPIWLDALRGEEPAPPLPPRLADHFKAQGQGVLAQHVLHRAALRRAAEALTAADVPYTVFKGAHLARVLYDTPAHRPAGDIDVLVHPENLRRAVEALGEAGFVRKPRDELSHEVSLAGHHAELDLHWEPMRPGRTRTNLGPKVIEAAVALDGIRVPSPPHALLLALIHPAITDHVTGQLIRALDVDRWVRTLPTDWMAVANLARSLGVSTAAWAMATWTRRWFGTPIPPDSMARLAPAVWRRRYLEAWLERDPAGSYEVHATAVRGLFSLGLEDGAGDAVRFLGTMVFRRQTWRHAAQSGML